MRLPVAFLLAVLCSHAGAAEEPCAAAGPLDPLTDRLQVVSQEGDLFLASGHAVRLAGLRLPEPPWFDEALALMRSHVGRPMRIVGPPATDRWGRRPVRLVVVLPGSASNEPSADLGEMLVGAGLALVDPEEGDGPCLQALLAGEAGARSRRVGVWAGDRYTPIPVAAIARLKDRIGRFALVEGRVRSVGERAQQTYLNFSSDWANDFTIIVPKRIWNRMAERGLDAAALRGRSIRARGFLEDRQGPSLTAAGPEVIEVIEGRRRLQAR